MCANCHPQIKDQPPQRIFARYFHGSVAADDRLAKHKADMLPLVNDLCRQLGALRSKRRADPASLLLHAFRCPPSRPLCPGCTKLSTVIIMHRYPWWMPSLFRISDLMVRVTDDMA